MRIVHLADLHLGRSLAEFDLIDLQKELLEQILTYIAEQNADAVVIAGDVYDQSLPPVQAVNLLSGFLCALARRNVPALIIAGNHDSPDRLSFMNGVLEESGIHIVGDYRVGQPPVTLTDQYGEVDFFLMPFFRPGLIRKQLPDEPISGYDDAVRCAIERMNVREDRRSVLVAHQYVCGAQLPIRSDSEMVFVGGTEMVSAAPMKRFDYTALGHLHQAQRVGGETVRYAGAPLKYALGESGALKSFTVVDLLEKGTVVVSQQPLKPSINLRSVRGRLDELLSRPASDDDGDFLEVLLTDEEPVFDAMHRLRARYPRVVNVRRERDMMLSRAASPLADTAAARRDPFAAFARFGEERIGRPLTEAEENEIRDIIRETEKEEDE